MVLLTGCIDAEEAFSFIDVRLLALILAMLAIGAALEHLGAVTMVVSSAAHRLEGLSPVAIGLAQALEVDARTLVVAVMAAASASFATPIGYQTNMMVYGLGGGISSRTS